MQYALIKINDRDFLVSANEMQSLNLFQGAIVEQAEPDEAEFPFHICYGCYMPQPGIEAPQALEDLKGSCDHWLGYIQKDMCHIIGFHEVEPMEVQRRGRSIVIPFAALVQAHDPVIEQIGHKTSVQAVTGFLRYAGMSPADNILNRRGIIALKGIERRIKDGQVSPTDWREHIDCDRAYRTALRIK